MSCERLEPERGRQGDAPHPGRQPAAVVEHADEDRRRLVRPVLGVEQLGAVAEPLVEDDPLDVTGPAPPRVPRAGTMYTPNGSVGSPAASITAPTRARAAPPGRDPARSSCPRVVGRRPAGRRVGLPSLCSCCRCCQCCRCAGRRQEPAPAIRVCDGQCGERRSRSATVRGRNAPILGRPAAQSTRPSRASAAGVRMPHQNRSRPSTSTTRAAGTAAAHLGAVALPERVRLARQHHEIGRERGDRVEVGRGIAVGRVRERIRPPEVREHRRAVGVGALGHPRSPPHERDRASRGRAAPAASARRSRLATRPRRRARRPPGRRRRPRAATSSAA